MNHRFSVIVLPQASTDAESIFDWLKTKSPQGARTWYEALMKAFQDLEEQGHIYALAPEVKKMKRAIWQKQFRTPHGRTYRILYEIESDQLYILHIRAPGQKMLKRFRRRPDE